MRIILTLILIQQLQRDHSSPSIQSLRFTIEIKTVEDSTCNWESSCMTYEHDVPSIYDQMQETLIYENDKYSNYDIVDLNLPSANKLLQQKSNIFQTLTGEVILKTAHTTFYVLLCSSDTSNAIRTNRSDESPCMRLNHLVLHKFQQYKILYLAHMKKNINDKEINIKMVEMVTYDTNNVESSTSESSS
ncbi:hypothetical protein HZS_249 [Henneguya salminicola]|nr:hypothetical protein HZS_249 [Henneguya salminicola]